MLIDKQGSGQVAHNLMYLNQDLPAILQVKGHWLDVGIDLAPLLRPVVADFFRSTDKTAFKCSRPSHVGSHKGKGSSDVTCVEGVVRCAQQLDFWNRLIWHKR